MFHKIMPFYFASNREMTGKYNLDLKKKIYMGGKDITVPAALQAFYTCH